MGSRAGEMELSALRLGMGLSVAEPTCEVVTRLSENGNGCVRGQDNHHVIRAKFYFF